MSKDPDIVLLVTDPLGEDPDKLVSVATGDLWRSGKGGELTVVESDPRKIQLFHEAIESGSRLVFLYGGAGDGRRTKKRSSGGRRSPRMKP